MDKSELQKRILQEEDYIRCPKCSNSLSKFLARTSDGINNTIISRFLMIPEEEVAKLYQEAIEILRREMVDNGK